MTPDGEGFWVMSQHEIDEILRWTTPSIHKRRTATRDVRYKGQHIKVGDKVTYWEMSANRDADVFDDPFPSILPDLPTATLPLASASTSASGLASHVWRCAWPSPSFWLALRRSRLKDRSTGCPATGHSASDTCR